MSVHTDVELILDRPEQLKALGDATRARILRLLESEPASAKGLSEMLEMSHGKVGHHIKVLEQAGFVAVVEERKVRAMTERLYGLTYGRLRFSIPGGDRLGFALSQARLEAADSQPFDPPAMLVTVPMSEATAREFSLRLRQLVDEFTTQRDASSQTTFGIVGAVFATDTER